MPNYAGPIKFPVPADRYNTAYGEPQWWKELAETAAAAISAKADAGHAHSWAQITGKPTSFTPAAHTHAWAQITGKPSTFPPSAHEHDSINQPGFEVDISTAGAFAGRAGGANTFQFDLNTGRMVAGNVPWGRLTDIPVELDQPMVTQISTGIYGVGDRHTTPISTGIYQIGA